MTSSIQNFGGEADEFGGEASPPAPPLDETLNFENTFLQRRLWKSWLNFEYIEVLLDFRKQSIYKLKVLKGQSLTLDKN